LLAHIVVTILWLGTTIVSVASVAWLLAGSEEILLEPDAVRLRYRRRILEIPIYFRTFDLNQVHNLEVWADSSSAFGFAPLLGDGSSTIAFECGEDTVRVGDGIDTGEAITIVQLLQDRWPGIVRTE